jgi:hypothetical protein
VAADGEKYGDTDNHQRVWNFGHTSPPSAHVSYLQVAMMTE